MAPEALAALELAHQRVLAHHERQRPEDKRWDWWVELKQRAITRALDRLEQQTAQLRKRVDLGTICIAVALGYLDLRGAVGEWRESRPALAAWYAEFAKRPSMIATAPPG